MHYFTENKIKLHATYIYMHFQIGDTKSVKVSLQNTHKKMSLFVREVYSFLDKLFVKRHLIKSSLKRQFLCY